MKTLFLLTLALLLTGCSSTVKQSNTGRGWVRNVWARSCFEVTFERDDGMLFVYDFANHPAVWDGMYGSIDYTYDSSWNGVPCPYTAGAVQRWRQK